MKRFRATTARLAAGAAAVVALATVARADSWVPLTPGPAPRSYVSVAAPWGTSVYAAGGVAGTAYLDTFEVYVAATDTWRVLKGLPTPRAGCVLAAVSGSLYAIGGTAGETGLKTTEGYSPFNDRWLTTGALAPMPTARRWPAGAAIGGTIYVTGGIISGTILGTVEAYYPATNTWGKCPAMPTPRFLHAATAIGGKLYCVGGATALYGGANNTNVKVMYLPTVEVFDPATRTWTQLAPMPTGRIGCAAASPGNGMLYAVGGLTASGSTAVTERYNPTLDAWERRADLAVAALPPDPAAGRLGLGVASPPGSVNLFAVYGIQAGAAAFDASGTWLTSGTLYAATERYDRSAAALSATVSVEPDQVAVGASATVYLELRNEGDAAVTGLTPGQTVRAGSGALTLLSGPVSATWFSGLLTPGERTVYWWRYDADSAGTAYFDSTASGTDVETLAPAVAAAFNDLPLTAGYRIKLQAGLTLSPLPLVPGQVLTVTLTVSNTGGGTAYEAGPTLKILQGAGLLALRSGPSPDPFTITITAQSVTVFTWTYSVSGAGFAHFSVTVTGLDELFGKRKGFAERTTSPSAPAGLLAAQADTAALVTWQPNPAYEAVASYALYRSTAHGFTPSPATLIANTSASWYEDAGLVNGVAYFYVLVATNADGTGPPSAEARTRPVRISDAVGEVRVTSTGASPLSFNPETGERAQFLVNVPPGEGTLRVGVYTLAGEEVRVLARDWVPPGKRIVEWDGRNGAGKIVASGGYLAVVLLPDARRIIRKVAVLR